MRPRRPNDDAAYSIPSGLVARSAFIWRSASRRRARAKSNCRRAGNRRPIRRRRRHHVQADLCECVLVATAAVAQAPADNEAKDQSEDADEVVCIDQPTTGSRVNRVRVCRTRAQWAASRAPTKSEEQPQPPGRGLTSTVFTAAGGRMVVPREIEMRNAFILSALLVSGAAALAQTPAEAPRRPRSGRTGSRPDHLPDPDRDRLAAQPPPGLPDAGRMGRASAHVPAEYRKGPAAEHDLGR